MNQIHTSHAISPNMSSLMNRIKSTPEKIHQWLAAYEGSKELPIYSSVDIREAGFKMAVVDTNIFPAGFNNLCEHGLEDAVKCLKKAILKRVPGCQNILIVAEEHTRNTWYLENIRILQEIIEKAGFNVKIATFLQIQPDFCDKTRFVELETAMGLPVRIHCFKKVLEDLKDGREKFSLIILNNDLTTGIPDILKQTAVPIYPSIEAGWHSRLKSHHFGHTADLMKEFASLIDVDPWLLSCQFRVVNDMNINEEKDQKVLADAASDLFRTIALKYKEHNITGKPYIVLKSDSGTYGMGVVAIESPDDILQFNRKKRNSLTVGKNSQPINRFLLQEGVPTIYNVADQVSEVVIYQIENNLIGGFYRMNDSKGERDNLNSKGMTFQKICPHLEKYGDALIDPSINMFDVYRILARIAAIATHREIIQLKNNA
ncbi:MAG: glutamate--cysteine ligase [Candidatus Omnitrophica bacterium]|nr:glutamate--cysteine ligase [Candidatus Omnitrophota bacterium]